MRYFFREEEAASVTAAASNYSIRLAVHTAPRDTNYSRPKCSSGRLYVIVCTLVYVCRLQSRQL